MRLRIAMITYYLPSESKIGSGWQAHGLANALQAAGHRVTVFSPCRKPLTAEYAHVHLPMTGRLRTFRWAAAVRRIALDEFDIVHAHGDDHLLMFKRRPFHVRTMHGSCFDEALNSQGFSSRLRMFTLGVTELLTMFVADVVVGVSKSSLRWFPWAPKIVISNGVDRNLYRREGAHKSPQPSILFVGTYERRKRGKLLQDSFARDVLRQIPEAELWMVCEDAPSAPNVKVLGRLSDADLAERYRRAWVFCLPSSYEGFGVPYAEAMCSGAAVVATPNLGAREVLQGGKYGCLVEPEELGVALTSLLRDHESRQRLADSAYEVAQRFAWPEIVSQYEAIYRGRHMVPIRRKRPTVRSSRDGLASK